MEGLRVPLLSDDRTKNASVALDLEIQFSVEMVYGRHIARYLSPEDCVRLNQVSRAWGEVLSPYLRLWRAAYEELRRQTLKPALEQVWSQSVGNHNKGPLDYDEFLRENTVFLRHILARHHETLDSVIQRVRAYNRLNNLLLGGVFFLVTIGGILLLTEPYHKSLSMGAGIGVGVLCLAAGLTAWGCFWNRLQSRDTEYLEQHGRERPDTPEAGFEYPA